MRPEPTPLESRNQSLSRRANVLESHNLSKREPGNQQRATESHKSLKTRGAKELESGSRGARESHPELVPDSHGARESQRPETQRISEVACRRETSSRVAGSAESRTSLETRTAEGLEPESQGASKSQSKLEPESP